MSRRFVEKVTEETDEDKKLYEVYETEEQLLATTSVLEITDQKARLQKKIAELRRRITRLEALETGIVATRGG